MADKLAQMLVGAEADTDLEVAEKEGMVEPEASQDVTEGGMIPETKSQVMAMKSKELNDFYASPACIVKIDGWSKMKVDEKRKAMVEALFPTDNAKAPEEIGDAPEQADDDKLAELSEVIEKLDDRNEIEARIDVILESEGLNDYQLGGLFERLQDLNDFSPYENFSQYVQGRFGIKYRKAMYLMGIYTGLLNAGVAWDQVKNVGWTKLKTIIGILTKDNVDEWVQKAAAMNTISLEQAVKDFQSSGESPTEPVSNMKTKTFKFAADQMEIVDDALTKAKAQSGTEIDSVACEFIMLEYLGNAPKPVPAAEKKSDVDAEQSAKIADLEKQIEELQNQAAPAAEMFLDPKAFYAEVQKKFEGDLGAAMNFLFGDNSGFEASFPTINLNVTSK
jgi:DNA-binding transcriptional MerR regulator